MPFSLSLKVVLHIVPNAARVSTGREGAVEGLRH